MEYAIASRTGEEVRAIDARNRGHEPFLCPVCSSAVHLAAGAKQQPHFRHERGMADPECENYHPSLGSGRGRATSGSAGQTMSSALWLVCAEEPRPDGPWHLELEIPRGGETSGTIEVSDAFPYPTTVAAPALRKRPVRIRVKAKQEYKLLVTGFDDDYRSGLRPIELQQPYALFSGTTSRMLRPSEPLRWGRDYFILGQLPIGDAPRPARATRLQLENNYECVHLELPAIQNSEIARWVAHVFSREILVPRARATLISPPASLGEDGRTWSVPANSEILIGWNQPVGAQRPNTVWAGERGCPEPDSVHLATGDFVISLGVLQSGMVSVWLDQSFDDHIVVETDDSLSPEVSCVQLTFSQGDSVVVAPTYSARCARLFTETMAGRKALVGLDGPERIIPVIHTKTPGAIRQLEKRVTLATLAEELKALTPPLDVIVDFGGFGIIRGALRRKEVACVALGPGLRGRIAWLLSLPNEHRSMESFHWCPKPELALLQQAVRNSDDVRLLRRLMSRRLWPALSQPHLRTIEQQLVGLSERVDV